MDRGEPPQVILARIGEGGEGRYLVGKQRVAANRRDVDRGEAGACGRGGQERPVRVPVLGEQRGGLIGLAQHRGDVRAAGDRGKKRVLAETAHRQREALERVVVQVLVGKRDHPVREPRPADIRNRLGRERPGEIDAENIGPAYLAGSLDPHPASGSPGMSSSLCGGV